MWRFRSYKDWKGYLYIASVLFFLGAWAAGEMGGGIGYTGNNVIGLDGMSGPYEVVYVVDGDTVDIDVDGEIERVRFLGVDTPETVKPNSPIECFGEEASKFTKDTLMGEDVWISFDKTQAERDRYGRLLVYVYMDGGQMFNESLLSEGYAYRYYSNVPVLYAERFDNLLEEAQKNNIGLWGEVCEG